MPAKTKRKKRSDGPVPSFAAFWDYMAEEDRRAIEEIVDRYTAFVGADRTAPPPALERFVDRE